MGSRGAARILSRWFLAEVQATGEHWRILMTFVQAAQQGSWRQALAVDLDNQRPIPKAKTDTAGHVETVAEQDGRGLMVSPAQAVELHSRYLEVTPRSPVRSRFTSTTDTIKVWEFLQTNRKRLISPTVSTSDWFTVVPDSLQAARVEEGGAVVVHAVQHQLGADITGSGTWITLTGGWPALTGGITRARNRFAAAWIDPWAAYIPPAGRRGDAARIAMLGCTCDSDPFAITAS